MGLNFDTDPGQTLLDEDEKEGLRIKSISTRSELDEHEQQNIEEAIQWLIGRAIKKEMILSEKFIRSMHMRMYGQVWRWAGEFRKTNKNIGVEKWQIPMALKNLLDDTLFWIENETYLPDEIAIRFKHRLVSIHCFPNGNGRHSRLMADIIIKKIFKLPEFNWGLTVPDARNQYLHAVRSADTGIMQELILFARS